MTDRKDFKGVEMDVPEKLSAELRYGNERTTERLPRTYKYFVICGTLVAVLIWGSGFLLSALSGFESRGHDYLVSPPLLSNLAFPGQTQKVIDGKIPLNFTVAREGVFSPEYTELQWIKEPSSLSNDKGTYVVREHVYSDINDEEAYETKYVIKSIVDKDYEYLLFNGSAFGFGGIEYDIDRLIASPDLKLAVLKTNSTHNFRHSTYALYWILNVNEKTIVPLYNTDDKLSVVSWSPDSTSIAYVYNNNIYIRDVHSGLVSEVTTDGSDQIFNGRPDWVYEEEVFGTDITLWWSPTGKSLAFLRLDDTEIPTFPITYFIQEGYEDYPKLVELKYPKPGYPNPPVDVGIYNLDSQVTKLLNLESANFEDKLITQVTWVSEDDVLVRLSTRSSDLLEFYLVDSTNFEKELVRTSKIENGWFEVTFDTFYIPKDEKSGLKADGYIDTVVVDGYNHLAYFSPPSNSEGLLLTKGQWEVTDGSVSYDYSTHDIFFTSTLKSPVERHVHSVNLLDSITTSGIPEIKNVTDTSKEGYFRTSFSSGSRYLLLTYAGPSVPYQELIDLKTNDVVKVLETNNKLSKNLQKYALPEIKHSVISLGKDSNGREILANAVETFPLNFNPKVKYPVLFYVYGGPGSQLVTKTFSVGFSSIVAAELNAIVVTVDGRGTGYNTHNDAGAQYKYIVRDLLGHYEPIDQISAAKIWSKRSYVDENRIAIWGWSYGGFMTLKTLETDYDHVFKYGVSVAPVTKWKLYDSIYTERYMRTPQENPEGYKIASINNVTNFHDVTRFLVMHGTGDDNVHFQNTMKLLDDFNVASVENFDFLAFPDSDHSISFHNGNHVIYHRILKWLRRAFNNEYVQFVADEL